VLYFLNIFGYVFLVRLNVFLYFSACFEIAHHFDGLDFLIKLDLLLLYVVSVRLKLLQLLLIVVHYFRVKVLVFKFLFLEELPANFQLFPVKSDLFFLP
jgi:hypothetical protein